MGGEIVFIFALKLKGIMQKHKLVHYITIGCDSRPSGAKGCVALA